MADYSQGFGGASYADWATFLVGLYNSQKKGKFQNVPMSPDQKQLFDWSYGNLKNTPNSSDVLFPVASHYVTNPSSIDVGALKAGNIGYKPGAPFDASKLTGAISTPPPSSTPAPQLPQGGGGDPAAGAVAPPDGKRDIRVPTYTPDTGGNVTVGGGPGDFNYPGRGGPQENDMPVNTVTGNINDPQWVSTIKPGGGSLTFGDISQWVSTHPGSMNLIKGVAAAMGGPAAGGVTQLFQWFANWYNSRQGQQGQTPPPSTGTPPPSSGAEASRGAATLRNAIASQPKPRVTQASRPLEPRYY
jgi:hypothetical protein